MGIADIFALLGGLALFLYGMQMMSRGLEDAAGAQMKRILERLTANRVLGVAVGAGITAVIQSSSATTVMVVGFVNSGMMTLRQAVWIIMGANIGTTVTGLLIAMDVDLLAPLFAFVGVVLVVFIKRPKANHVGQILAGLGILFIGMDMMSGAMKPLRSSELFLSLMGEVSNPLLGILVGAIFTAVIQSSSAAVGIFQTLAATGVLPFSGAVFLLFGSNIGTCITAVLAAIGASRNAKRTTIIHLMFNVIGTAVFTVLCLTFPLAGLIESLLPGAPAAQIAAMHTTFNFATTLLLLPFGQYMALAAEKILPDEEAGKKEPLSLKGEFNIANSALGFSAIHFDTLRQEIGHMLSMARENVDLCFRTVMEVDFDLLKRVEETEEKLDQMNKAISQYISKILVHNNSGQNIADIEEYFGITGDAERIGDHALNIAGYVEGIRRDNIHFSEDAMAEIEEMRLVTGKAMDKLLAPERDMTVWLTQVAALEQQMDDMTERYRSNHLERMRQGLCSEEGCILFSELLTDFERIGDHALNIAQSYAKMSMAE